MQSIILESNNSLNLRGHVRIQNNFPQTSPQLRNFWCSGRDFQQSSLSKKKKPQNVQQFITTGIQAKSVILFQAARANPY